jgi:Arc/MetJ-type ribon-helix-helix transcriptional regulator
METVQIRLTGSQIKSLDSLVKEGIYSSRGEAVRDAVRRLELTARLLELQTLAKNKGVTKNVLLKELNSVEDELFQIRRNPA